MVNSFQLEIPVLERFLMLGRRLCGLRNRNTNRTTEHMEKGERIENENVVCFTTLPHFACASNAFIFSAFAEMQTTKQMRARRAQQTLAWATLDKIFKWSSRFYLRLESIYYFYCNFWVLHLIEHFQTLLNSRR